jgi:hypothetical protein
VRVYRRDGGLYAGPLAAVGNRILSSLTKGNGLILESLCGVVYFAKNLLNAR